MSQTKNKMGIFLPPPPRIFSEYYTNKIKNPNCNSSIGGLWFGFCFFGRKNHYPGIKAAFNRPF